MKKFLLIEAQKFWEIYLPGYNVNLPLDVVQPLGLLQIAAMIRSRDQEAEIKILDLRLCKNDYAGVFEAVKEYNPELVGFRIASRDSLFANDIVKKVRDVLPEAVLMAGGPHVTAWMEKVMEEAPLDFAVYGEGELTMLDFLYHFDKKKGFEDVKGLIYRNKEGKVIVNEPREYVENLDELPMPLWDLVDHQKYFDIVYYPTIPAYLNARREVISIFTSRGCPYKCTFCHNIFGKKFRAQSPQKVLKEIEYLYDRHGVRQFDFRDDIFNLDKKRVFEICDLIIKRGLDIKINFPNGLRGDIMDEDLVLKMKAAGMFQCTYALETASPRLQKMINKNINLEKLKKTIRFTSAQDIIVRIFVMLGFPTETMEEMKMTVDYVLDPAIDFVLAHSVNPFEGTEMAHLLHKEGVNIEEFRDKFDYLSVKISISEVEKNEHLILKDEMLNRFFSDERLLEISRKLMLYIPKREPAKNSINTGR